MRGPAPSAPYEVLWEIIPGTQSIQPLRQIIFELPSGASHPVMIPDHMKGDPDLLRRELRQRGLDDAKPVHGWAPVEDIPWVNELLEFLTGAPPSRWETPEFQVEGVTLPATVTMKEEYFRAIAKIAFHYTLKTFATLTGLEPEFTRIREYIWSGAGGGRARPVRHLERQVYDNLRMGYRPKYWSHILGVDRTYRRIVAYAQFFIGPRSLPSPYEIEIGANPARMFSPPDRRAHLFVMDPAAAADGFIGVMEDALVTPYIIPVGFTL